MQNYQECLKVIAIRIKPHNWTKEQINFVREIAKGKYKSEIRDEFNKEFNLDLTLGQIKGVMFRNGITSDINGKFKIKHTPWNKGMKGLQIGGKATQFKKGQAPTNYRPVGSERIDSKDGYIVIKVKDKGTYQERWRHKHVVEWEKYNGKVPKNHTVVFLDGNKENINIDNLALLSRSELLRMNQEGLFSNDPEATKAGIALVRLKQKVHDLDLY